MKVEPHSGQISDSIKSTNISIYHTVTAKMKNYVLAFCERGSMHGLNYLAQQHLSLFEKFLWFGLFGVSVAFSVYVGFLAIDRYQTQSTVVSLERDYHYWNSTLPGVTVCPHKRLNKTLFEQFASELQINGSEKIEFFNFLESLANSTYKNFKDITNYASTDRLLQQLNIKPEKYMQIIFDLANKNEFNGFDNRTYHEFVQDTHLNFCQSGELIIATRQILTEFGLCFMTNTFLSDKYTASYFINGQRPIRNETWWQNIDKVLNSSFFQNDVSYHFRGCGTKSPYVAFLHSAYEVMDIERNLGDAVLPLHISVEVMEIVVNDGFEKETTISQRKCRFPHESNLTHFPIYTKNLCMQECRLNLVFQVCKCIPHFYPNRLSTPKPVCHYKTLINCVGANEEYFLKLYPPKTQNGQIKMDLPKVECSCLQNCQDAIVNPLETYTIDGAYGILDSNTVEVTLTRLPRKRLKRQVIFSFTDLLVSIGGTAGLFLGFSVLGALEILYFFSLRLLWYLQGYSN